MAHISPNAVVTAAAMNLRAKQLTEPLFKKSPVFAMAKQKGQVKYKQGGTAVEWPVRYRRRTIRAGGSPLAMQFPEVNRVMKAEIPYRVYELGEGISKYSELATKNDPNAYFNAFDKMLEWSMDDFTTDLSKKVYVDGNASGSQELFGFESLFNATAVATYARVGTPAGTYGGISQVLGAYGGSWTAEGATSEAWPTGWGSDQYRFWSSFHVDTTNTKWSETTKDWKNNWQEQVTWLLAMMSALNDEKPDAILLTPMMLVDAKTNLRSNQRFELTQNKDTIEAGVNAMTVEGIEFIEDGRIVSAASAAVAYAVTWSKLQLLFMGSQEVETDQDLDLTTKNKRVALDSHVQMKCESPCYFGKFSAIS